METKKYGKRIGEESKLEPSQKLLKADGKRDIGMLSAQSGATIASDASTTPTISEEPLPLVHIYVMDRNPHIFDADELYKLQVKHRIFGKTIGPCPGESFQTDVRGLPCLLLREEAQLAVEKGFAVLCDESKRVYPPDYPEQQRKYQEADFERQRKAAKKQKLDDVKPQLDKILEGKKKKLLKNGKTEEANSLTNDMVIKQLEENIKPIPDNKLLVQRYFIHPLKKRMPPPITTWDFPRTPREKLRYQTFKDLWEKGYAVTCGASFGGDFLVYPFDPIACHASHIVRCCSPDQIISLSEFCVGNRVATTTNKKFVIASVKQGSLTYKVFQWAGMKL